jgi:hypothetical protein
MALVTLGGVKARRTLELAASGIFWISIQLALDYGVGLMIFGETIIFFCTTIKQASLLYFPA